MRLCNRIFFSSTVFRQLFLKIDKVAANYWFSHSLYYFHIDRFRLCVVAAGSKVILLHIYIVARTLRKCRKLHLHLIVVLMFFNTTEKKKRKQYWGREKKCIFANAIAVDLDEECIYMNKNFIFGWMPLWVRST